MRTFTIENTEIFEIKRSENTYFPESYLSLTKLSPDEAYKEKGCKTYQSHGGDFWGDVVFAFNFIDEQHKKDIIDWLIRNRIGKKRAKRIAKVLVSEHKTYEDFEGVKFD